ADLVFTEQEAERFRQLKLISGFVGNLSASCNVQIGYRPNHKDAAIPDYRFKCHQCQLYRSFTLMTKLPVVNGIGGNPSICCFCVNEDQEDAEILRSDGQEQHRSHMTECRTCHSLYAVVRTNRLNVQPKCYACRTPFCLLAHRIQCDLCKNTFLDAAQLC